MRSPDSQERGEGEEGGAGTEGGRGRGQGRALDWSDDARVGEAGGFEHLGVERVSRNGEEGRWERTSRKEE